MAVSTGCVVMLMTVPPFEVHQSDRRPKAATQARRGKCCPRKAWFDDRVPTNRRLVLFVGTGFLVIAVGVVWTVLSVGPPERHGRPGSAGSPPTQSARSSSPTGTPVP